MSQTLVSIIICTRNRAEDLRQTLASIAKVDVPVTFAAELIVVDNASTDHTRQITEAFFHPRIPVRYLQELKDGKSRALNTAIEVCQGQILIFTDDDVRVPSNWIEAISAPIRNGTCDAVAGGVRIAPHLLRPWMTDLHRMVLAETQRIDPHHVEDLVGANMAFARHVLQRVPRYDVELGPGALGAWEETLFSYQLTEAGFRLAAALDVAIEHHFDSTRLTRSALLSSARKHGIGLAYVRFHWMHDDPGFLRALAAWWAREFRLVLWRIIHPIELFRSEGCQITEFVYVRSVELYKGMATFALQRMRKYARRALLKSSSDACPPSSALKVIQYRK